MKHLSSLLLYQSPLARAMQGIPARRAQAIEPVDNGAFILPIKQSFIKNRRIMDSTARLVALLSGWAGQGGPVETTQGILAKHIGKSVRQVQRMLADAMREGYLVYAYTKSRIGMITGIKIYLRLERIRKQKGDEKRRNPATTKTSDTNGNYINYKKDEGLTERLKRLSQAMGVEYEFG